MPDRDLGSVAPEEFLPLLGAAYAIAILTPPPMTVNGEAVGAQSGLWIAAGVDPEYVADWLEGEARHLRESLTAPVAPEDVREVTPNA